MKAACALLISSALSAANFPGASAGCWMAHCGPQLTNSTSISLPSGLGLIYNDTSGGNSGWGLGCASNGTVAACTYTNHAGTYTGPYLKVYDASGNVLWTSSLLDYVAIACVPMVGADGGVVACDDTQVIRFDPSGAVLWATCLYGVTLTGCTCPDRLTVAPCSLVAGHNYPSSPIQVANGSIVLATNGTAGHGGQVFNVSSDTGALLSAVYLGQSGGDSYVTSNTPCVSSSTGADGGNRVFIITNWSADTSRARMYALTVGDSITQAWVYPPFGDFTGPSQASPLCASNGVVDGVYTDAADSTQPTRGAVWGWRQTDGAVIFACDLGMGTGCATTQSHVNGGFALDPRAGTPSFWLFSGGAPQYQRRSAVTGNVVQGISLKAPFIPGETCDLAPSSATMVSTDAGGNPALIGGLIPKGACLGGSYVAAIDAVTGTLQEWFRIGMPPLFAVGQFAMMLTEGGDSRIAFGVTQSGMVLIGGAE